MNLLRISLNVSNKLFSKNYIKSFHIQNCKTLTTSSGKPIEIDGKEFKLIYYLPNITTFYFLQRMKIYTMLCTSLSLPISTILWNCNILSKDYLISTAFVGITSSTALLIAGHIFNNIIGRIYIDKENQNVKISYLNAKGQRINLDWPVEEIIPIMDQEEKFYIPWLYVKRYSEKKISPKLFLNHGRITDNKKFCKALGYYI